MNWAIASSVGAVIMAVGMIFIRMRASKRPTNVKRIILPPVFMSTGAAMFIFEYFRVAWIQVIEAFFVGAVFSILLILTTKFEKRDGDIFLIPSKWFIVTLFGLLLIRIVLKAILGQHISLGETGGMFFILAFGMIITWRISMLFKYLRIVNKI
ncbi:CcdC family protein [Saliterribacillus persicus]|uniref:Membrane protein CcdC involved in cytochrome C biogenesis n=1 Tax=Saliterribacillus persicus TaxID=930114 RepID=A0A368XRE2_9BACI|nr:cytochrome c biogenesis protein CcdC [Saliterribacillus persicus]RCW70610.1 membrane protein CcdC involved in cytochrome C biogenesis [Saliterribacillus persicus]